MKKEVFIRTIYYYFIGLFTYAALSKLFMYSTFLRDLARAPLTDSYPLVYSIVVPFIELLIVVLLIRNRSRSIGLIAAFIMMLIFTIYITYVLNMTTERPCSCGGIFRDMTWRNHLKFNIISAVIAAIGIVLNHLPFNRKTEPLRNFDLAN